MNMGAGVFVSDTGLSDQVDLRLQLSKVPVVGTELARFIQRFEAADDLTRASMLAALRSINRSDPHIVVGLENNLTKFELSYEGQYSKLEVRPGIFGKREVRFTLKGGASNLDNAYAEINAGIQTSRNYPVPKEHSPAFRIYISSNDDLPNGNKDIGVIYTPVIKKSANRVRFGTDPQTSHAALLSDLKLEFVNNDLHRLATGAFRIKEGFPLNPKLIGKIDDPGDLNEGMIVRTKKSPNAKSGTVATDRRGVFGRRLGPDYSSSILKVAGAYPQELFFTS